MVNFNATYLNYPKSNLDDLFINICSELEKEELILDDNKVVEGLREREMVAPTLFENEVGIPHASNDAIIETTLVLITSREGITYSDGRIAKLIIFLLTPPESGENHLQMMSELSKILLNKDSVEKIINCNNTTEIDEIFNQKQKIKEIETSITILAITACTTGIAHTYIAANALEYAAHEMGIEIFVERQGANGIERPIPTEEIEKAKGIIVAADVEVEGLERFEGLPLIKTKVADPIENSEKLLRDVITSSEKIKVVSPEKKTIQITDCILSAFSKLIPLITFAVIGLSIGRLFENIEPFDTLYEVSNILLYISIPIFCAELIKNISGKTAYPVGLFIGVLFTPTLFGIQAAPNIFVAVAMVVIFSKLIVLLRNSIKLPDILMPIKVHLIIPVIMFLLIITLNHYLVSPMIGNYTLFINSLSSTDYMILQLALIILIVYGICYDYGGRVNKLTNLIAIGLAFNGTLMMTACNLAIVIPPLGMSVLKFFDYKSELFTGKDYPSSKRLFITGLLAMSEGVKPFVNSYQQVIRPINILGTLIGILVAIKLGAVAYYPLPAIWAWFLVDGITAYLIGILVGILIIAILNYIALRFLTRKEI